MDMDAGLRKQLESRFDAGLENVRISRGASARALTRAVAADACAIGNCIFFAPGAYRPHTADGFELLAHEVAHILQQRIGAPVAANSAEIEAEAREAGRAVARGARWRVTSADLPYALRCAASLKPGSSTIKIDSYPTVKAPTVAGGKVHFKVGNSLKATGSVMLTGSHPASGWKLGFLQAEWAETNWLYYRGQHDAEDSERDEQVHGERVSCQRSESSPRLNAVREQIAA